MKMSKVLSLAKKKLPTAYRVGICGAIYDAYYHSRVPLRDRTRAEALISERLGPFAYATQWLAWQVLYPDAPIPTSYYDVEYKKANAMDRWMCAQETTKIQSWRHAWLDQMIAEFQAKGD